MAGAPGRMRRIPGREGTEGAHRRRPVAVCLSMRATTVKRVALRRGGAADGEETPPPRRLPSFIRPSPPAPATLTAALQYPTASLGAASLQTNPLSPTCEGRMQSPPGRAPNGETIRHPPPPCNASHGFLAFYAYLHPVTMVIYACRMTRSAAHTAAGRPHAPST